MAVSLTKVCSDVVVQDLPGGLVFPPEVVGSIKPGSLDHLTKSDSIKWGVNMTEPIAPGTIPVCCRYLLFPETYGHAIDDIKLSSDVMVYLHHTRVHIGPSSRMFYVWGMEGEPEPTLPAGYEYLKGHAWRRSGVYRELRVREAQKAPEPVAVPEPVQAPVCTASPIEVLEIKINKQGADIISVKNGITTIKELVVSQNANRVVTSRFEAQATADLESIKSTVAALSDKLDQFVKALSP